MSEPKDCAIREREIGTVVDCKRNDWQKYARSLVADIEERDRRIADALEQRNAEVKLRQAAERSATALRERCERLEKALRAYVLAQGRMLDRWAEGDDKVKAGLWRDLHDCEEAGRAALAEREGGGE